MKTEIEPSNQVKLTDGCLALLLCLPLVTITIAWTAYVMSRVAGWYMPLFGLQPWSLTQMIGITIALWYVRHGFVKQWAKDSGTYKSLTGEIVYAAIKEVFAFLVILGVAWFFAPSHPPSSAPAQVEAAAK